MRQDPKRLVACAMALVLGSASAVIAAPDGPRDEFVLEAPEGWLERNEGGARFLTPPDLAGPERATLMELPEHEVRGDFEQHFQVEWAGVLQALEAELVSGGEIRAEALPGGIDTRSATAVLAIANGATQLHYYIFGAHANGRVQMAQFITNDAALWEKHLPAIEDALTGMAHLRGEPSPVAQAVPARPAGSGGSGPEAEAAADTLLVEDPAPFTIAASDELDERTGRLTIQPPASSTAAEASIDIFRAGSDEPVLSFYGGRETELPPGIYAIAINGARVDNVPIRAKRQTTLHTGVLRMEVGADTRVRVVEPDRETNLVTRSGARDVLLPVGSYDIEVDGRVEAVEIVRDEVTER